MEKKINVIVNGEKISITYIRTGDRFDVEVSDTEIRKHIPNRFFLINGKAFYLIGSDRTKELFSQIADQILASESLLN